MICIQVTRKITSTTCVTSCKEHHFLNNTQLRRVDCGELQAMVAIGGQRGPNPEVKPSQQIIIITLTEILPTDLLERAQVRRRLQLNRRLIS